MKNEEEIRKIRQMLMEQSEIVTVEHIVTMLLAMADTLDWVLEDKNTLEETIADYEKAKQQALKNFWQ